MFALLRRLAPLLLAVAAYATPAAAQDAAADPIAALPWTTGPATGAIASRATIRVPDGFAFLDAAGTRRLNELMENPASGRDEYVLAPDDLEWIAFFSFDEVGYVKDEETLDADDILASVREGTEQSNVERRDRGWDTLRIVGWSFKPQYDRQTKLLEWAILAENEGSKDQVVNYNTRLLGRRGVMEVTLVTDPAQLDASVAAFKKLMPGYAFSAGETYAEYKEGDHVAEYGLAALITGGAAAVASKKGVFAAIGAFLLKGWKLLLVGLFGVAALARRLLRRKDREPS